MVATGLPDLLDLPGGTRPLRAWQEVLIDALLDAESTLREPSIGHEAFGRPDHAIARLVVLIEDYCADAAGVYRSLDEDVEKHDTEHLRRDALLGWAAAVRAPASGLDHG